VPSRENSGYALLIHATCSVAGERRHRPDRDKDDSAQQDDRRDDGSPLPTARALAEPPCHRRTVTDAWQHERSRSAARRVSSRPDRPRIVPSDCSDPGRDLKVRRAFSRRARGSRQSRARSLRLPSRGVARRPARVGGRTARAWVGRDEGKELALRSRVVTRRSPLRRLGARVGGRSACAIGVEGVECVTP
jgi:hypothetical protein